MHNRKAPTPPPLGAVKPAPPAAPPRPVGPPNRIIREGEQPMTTAHLDRESMNSTVRRMEAERAVDDQTGDGYGDSLLDSLRAENERLRTALHSARKTLLTAAGMLWFGNDANGVAHVLRNHAADIYDVLFVSPTPATDTPVSGPDASDAATREASRNASHGAGVVERGNPCLREGVEWCAGTLGSASPVRMTEVL